jgi:hypothetical protein
VQSIPPPNGPRVPDGSEWLGSPSFPLTHRPKVGNFDDTVTFHPTRTLYLQRAVIDGLRILIPGYLALAALSAWSVLMYWTAHRAGPDHAAGTLATAALYAQPGGGNSVKRAYRQTKGSARTIRDYVRSGGRYLGICMGGYLAGHWRGFGLLPGGTDQFITSPGADVTKKKDTLVEVDWRGRRHKHVLPG